MELHEGTRRFRNATVSARLDDGSRLALRADAIGAAIAMQGLGYSGGYDDRQGLGVWRGEQVVELDSWDVSAPARIDYGNGRSNEHWHRIQAVAVTATHAGQAVSRGTGSMTLVLSGRIASLGLS